MASKRSKSALADFMMYSFNRWQKASNPWLNKEAWEDCAVTQEEVNHALNARECSCALDLGQVNDPSAFAMCSFIPDEVQPSEEGEPVGKYYFDIVIFMTEKYAEDHAATEGFLEWAKAGHLILMPGDTQDYGFIRKTVRQYAATRRIFEIAYDPMFAEDVTQQLQQGTEYEDGIGCQRVAFPQTGPVWAKPTKDFENALMARQLRHPNNPVLNWMSGHCEAKEDAYSNKRPIKPDNQAKKIDGIIAMVMSHARATLRRPQPSISLM
jgi:phage terminase large subunit-like protein